MIQESSAYRDFYASVIDSVGDGVVVLDCKGFPSLINPAAEEMLGISRRQAESTHCSALFRQEEILLEMVEKTATTGMIVSDHENIILKRLGHLTPVSVTTSPLVLNNGQTIGTILVLRDLTNVRELEDAVRHADRLSTIGTLAAGLAHEIKNPLGGIKGAAQLLEQDLPDDSELREYTGVMIREVQRVNRSWRNSRSGNSEETTAFPGKPAPGSWRHTRAATESDGGQKHFVPPEFRPEHSRYTGGRGASHPAVSQSREECSRSSDGQRERQRRQPCLDRLQHDPQR